MIWIIVIIIAAWAAWTVFRRPKSGTVSDDMEFLDFIIQNDAWVVLDTETTGLGAKAEVIEIAIVDKSGTVLLDTLVKPKGRISAESIAIHGISRKMVSDAPPWSEVARKFENIVRDRMIIAYNAEFDFRLIGQTYERNGINNNAFRGVCAMLAYSDYRGGSKKHKLTDACDHEGVSFPKQHRAVADAEATRRLVLAMSERDSAKTRSDKTYDDIELSIDYVDSSGMKSHREISARNYYTNKKGEVVIRAWCHERNAVRHFKLDKIAAVRDDDGVFEKEDLLLKLEKE